jgi:ankyrin repeat protein
MDFKVKNEFGETLLHHAVKYITNESPLIIKYILDQGVDPNDCGFYNNQAPLHYLISYSLTCKCRKANCVLTKYIENVKTVIDLLLEYGADINTFKYNKVRVSCGSERFSMTPYMLGIWLNKDKRILDHLKEKGSNFDHIKQLYRIGIGHFKYL